MLNAAKYAAKYMYLYTSTDTVKKCQSNIHVYHSEIEKHSLSILPILVENQLDQYPFLTTTK